MTDSSPLHGFSPCLKGLTYIKPVGFNISTYLCVTFLINIQQIAHTQAQQSKRTPGIPICPFRDKEEQHETDGYYVVNGKGYWLCDVPKQNNIPTQLSCEIVCDEPIICNGLEPSVFMAKFYDSEGKEIWVSPQWDIECDFKEKLNIEYVDNSIRISADNEKLSNKSFELSLNAFGYETTKLKVTIKDYL